MTGFGGIERSGHSYSDYVDMAAHDVIRAVEGCVADEERTVEETICDLPTECLHTLLTDRDDRRAIYLAPGTEPGGKYVHRRARWIIRGGTNG